MLKRTRKILKTCIRWVTYGAHATEVSCEKEHAVDKFEYQLCIVGVHIVSCPNQPGFYKDKSTVVLQGVYIDLGKTDLSPKSFLVFWCSKRADATTAVIKVLI